MIISTSEGDSASSESSHSSHKREELYAHMLSLNPCQAGFSSESGGSITQQVDYLLLVKGESHSQISKNGGKRDALHS